MTPNDVFRQVRFILDADHDLLTAVFAAADHEVTTDQLHRWLTGDEDPRFLELTDRELALFLNGLINLRRGRRAGPQPEPETRLTNNLIANKLKIAFELQGPDLIGMLALAGFQLSNHELSAFFRKPGHKHHRRMQDQVLRYLLRGMARKYRPDVPAEAGA